MWGYVSGLTIPKYRGDPGMVVPRVLSREISRESLEKFVRKDYSLLGEGGLLGERGGGGIRRC